MLKKRNRQFITVILLSLIMITSAFAQGVLQQDTRNYVNSKRYVFQKGSTIQFHPDGQVHMGTIRYNYSFYVGTKKVVFLNRTPLRFYPNGHVELGTIKNRNKFKAGKKEVYFKKRHTMTFLNNGRVISGTIYKDETFSTGNNKIISCLKGTKVIFDTKKNVLTCAYIKNDLALNGSVQNFIIKGNTKVRFWKNGVIRTAIMAKDTSVSREKGGKMKVKKEQKVSFYRNGNVEE